MITMATVSGPSWRMTGQAPGDALAPHRLAAVRVVLAGELPGRLDGLGAAGDEEGARDPGRRDLREPVGELDRRRVRVGPVRVVRQRAHLFEGDLPELLAVAVA